MDAFSYEILSLLKWGFLSAGGADSFEVEGTGKDGSARQFYVRRLEDNLVQPMGERHVREYGAGAGAELDDKMRALRSSSAMTFNLLGNDHAVMRADEGRERFRLFYEVRLDTRSGGMPAHLDAVLVGRERIIACEMKMLEWLLGRPGTLKPAYRAAGTYRSGEAADAFLRLAGELFDAAGTVLRPRYDAAQMFKHALGLYNACVDGTWKAQRRVELLNVVWTIGAEALSVLGADSRGRYENALAEERDGASFFSHAANRALSPLFDELGVSFDVSCVPVADFLARLDLDDGLRRTFETRYLLSPADLASD